EELMRRTNLDGSSVDEVIMGQAKQSSDVSNMARVALLRAGLPVEVPGYTLHRQCGSGVQAVNSAAQQIMTGLGDIIIAGGAESMSTAPYYVNNVRFGTKSGDVLLKDPNTASQPGSQPTETYGNLNMGITAENVAVKYGISREEQDEFALESQERMAHAISKGYFESQIAPYPVQTRQGV